MLEKANSEIKEAYMQQQKFNSTYLISMPRGEGL
jgi:hypothetical protein